jgi:hypothetical protein
MAKLVLSEDVTNTTEDFRIELFLHNLVDLEFISPAQRLPEHLPSLCRVQVPCAQELHEHDRDLRTRLRVLRVDGDTPHRDGCRGRALFVVVGILKQVRK